MARTNWRVLGCSKTYVSPFPESAQVSYIEKQKKQMLVKLMSTLCFPPNSKLFIGDKTHIHTHTHTHIHTLGRKNISIKKESTAESNISNHKITKIITVNFY